MDNAIHPLISIIMPAYNAARFIQSAVQSVLDQTYPNWELLIIDDASSDNTAELVQAFSDSRIRYCRVDRIGSPSGVRNVGLRMAEGDLIAFLDADDLFYPYALEKLATQLIENPTLTAVYGFAFHMDEDGQPLRQNIILVPQPDGTNLLPATYQVNWQKLLTGDISCLLSAMMMRKTTMQRVGFFNEALCGPEDYEYYVRLFLDNFDGVACIPEYIYQYRIYHDSLTKDPSRYQKVLNSVIAVMDWLFTSAPIPAWAREAYRSQAYTNCFRYLARERLLHNQPQLARQIIWLARKSPHVAYGDWVAKCLPLLIRSLLPFQLDHWLVNRRWDIRYWYFKGLRNPSAAT